MANEVIYEGQFVVGLNRETGMLLKPAPEGIEEAKEYVAAGDTHRGLFEMLEDWISNGWMWVPPEDIAALTDGEILTQDGDLRDDGCVHILPDGVLYWNSNYAVEDAVACWAKGKPVLWARA